MSDALRFLPFDMRLTQFNTMQHTSNDHLITNTACHVGWWFVPARFNFMDPCQHLQLTGTAAMSFLFDWTMWVWVWAVWVWAVWVRKRNHGPMGHINGHMSGEEHH